MIRLSPHPRPRGAAAPIAAAMVLLGALSCARPPAEAPSAEAPPAGSLRAGAASRVITPDPNGPGRTVYMGGLERGLPASGVHDDLYARALVLTDGAGRSVGLVVLDLIGFFHDDVLALRDELRARHPEVDLDHLAVASTHTHAGPDVIGLWLPIQERVDAGYIARIRAGAVDAVAEAWRRRRAARLTVGVTTAPGLALDTRLPELIDDTVLAIGIKEDASGEGIASLVNWNSHPSVAGGENSEISADFPAGVVARMEREWGGVALYASGALGGQIGSGRVRIRDLETDERPSGRMEKAAMIGDRIASLALAALSAAAPADPASVRVRVKARTLFVPLDNPRFAKGLQIGLIHPRRLYPPEGGGEGILPGALADPSVLAPGAFTLKTEVAVVDLGPAVWALIPGELYPEMSLGIYQTPQDPAADFQGAATEPALRRLDDRPVFLIGLANDELGYLIPLSQWDSAPPYAYGRDEPQYGEMNSVGPRAAPMIMQAFADLLGGG